MAAAAPEGDCGLNLITTFREHRVMARGRLISRTLGSSRKFMALHAKLGRLADFAQALYPLLVSCADDFGRQAGDAMTVKLAVFPSSPHRESDFTTALTAMHNVRLIDWYESDGHQIVQIVDFETHQPGLSRRTNSRFPEPPVNFSELHCNSVKFTPRARARKRTELNRTEPKGREENRTEQDQNKPAPEARRTFQIVEDLLKSS